MKKSAKNLTNTAVGALEAGDREYEVTDSKIGKMKLRVGVSGSKVFYLYYRIKGKARKYKIGRFGDIGVPAARKAAEKLLAQVALGIDPQSERIEGRRVQEAEKAGRLRTFLDEKYYPWTDVSQKVPVATRRVIEFNFSGFMDKPLGEISKRDFEVWRQKRLEGGTKPTTLNRARTALVAVMNKAVEWQVIVLNPLKGLKTLKVVDRGVVRWLSEAEEARLMHGLDQVVSDRDLELRTRGGGGDGYDWFRVFVKLLLWTGMRPVEALTLEWERVDLEGRRVEVDAAYSKTSKFRAIPINDKLLEVLSGWKMSRANGGDGGLLFPGADAKARVRVEKPWRRLMEVSGIENFRLYDLRHSFASRLVMNSVDIYTVSQLLGHSSVEMTKIYAHLAPEHLMGAVNRL